MSKKCTKCGESKNISEFYKNKIRKDGHSNRCKPCESEAHKINWKIYYKENKEAIINRAKMVRQRDKDKIKNRHRRYIKNNPDINHAHQAVQFAVRQGKLMPIKSLTCLYCGEKAKEYHHYKGYSKDNQLSVIPLCASCHRKTN